MKAMAQASLVAMAVIFLAPQIHSDAAQPRVTIDLRSHRSEIRVALLRYTPLKSSTRVVLEFVSSRLQPNGDAPLAIMDKPPPEIAGSKDRAARFIRVYLGQYYDHPEVVFLTAPVLMQREVTAIWIFDEHDRLTDIFVDKQTGTY